jgi:ABC-type amino acid transport substrate-binding protein
VRQSRRAALVLLGLLALLGARAARAQTPAPVEILVLKERGVGSPSLAQPYVDRFVGLAAEDNGWSAAKGQYLANRGAAEAFIKARSPHYGILSLAAFLALRVPHHLEVIGRVGSTLAGGQQYFIVSKSASDLAGCKGKELASDHFTDPRFIERVVARREFKLADFKLMKNQRPLQSLRQVLSGEADCALLDDAQLAELEHLQGSDAVKIVWKSKQLPPMAVVAFPAAPPAEKKKFREKLTVVCEGDGNTACAEVGIDTLAPAGASDYAEVVSAYGR